MKNKQVALISGTSSGLGLELALVLAQNNYTVFATMRNLNSKAKLLERAQAQNLELYILEMDVTNNISVANCVAQVIAEAGKIDLLINNAGAGFIRSTEQATWKEIEEVTNVNYLSVVRCVKEVLPHMRQQLSGHIINISSVGGLVGQPFNELYCAAKFAIEGYTESMATYITEAFNINFSLVEPGGISSEFANSVRSNLSQNGGVFDDSYKNMLMRYIDNPKRAELIKTTDMYQTPEQVARVIWNQAINCVNPPLRIRTSKWSEELCHLKTQADKDGLKLRQQVIDTFLN